MEYDQITLSNGLRIIGERIDHLRSVAVGLCVGAGSQYERAEEGGLSHFVEHMVFKGTGKRSARDIAERMDEVGGAIDAYTSKSHTFFHARVVDEDLPLAMDVIADMVTNPAFSPEELEKEKGVVIEEIGMAEDTPEDLASELLMQASYGEQPLARPILGTAARIRRCTSEELRAYWASVYHPQNAVLSVAGHYVWADVVALAERLLGGWGGEGYAPRGIATQPRAPELLTREKDIEQVQIMLGYPGIDAADPRNFEIAILNSVFGGAMSSRLFQRVREESGMAYSVYSFPSAYTDTGLMSVYAATSPDTALTVARMIEEEAARMAQDGMTEAEFSMTRRQFRASFILGQESTSARMQAIARLLLLRNKTETLDESLAKLKAVRLSGVNALAREIFSAPHATVFVGRSAAEIAKGYREGRQA